jgi:hypothetical protein
LKQRATPLTSTEDFGTSRHSLFDDAFQVDGSLLVYHGPDARRFIEMDRHSCTSFVSAPDGE